MTRTIKRKLVPVPLSRVDIDGGFWGPRLETARKVTLPIQYEQCRKTGRIDAWELDWREGMPNKPHIFWDSDVAKWIEAAGYSLAKCPDQKLERLVDGVIDLMEKAQQPDGYVNVHFTAVEPSKRWFNLRDWHELYCAGHLMEAAVAYYEGTGKRKLLDVMCRYADYIGEVFGPNKGQKRGYPGHEEIELAMVKLYRTTGEKRYLDLSRFFVDERGRSPHYYLKEALARGEATDRFRAQTVDGGHRAFVYNQSHKPVREQSVVVGHAVRATYLYAAMADLAGETGDRTLLDACRRLWRNLTRRRMYITGGIGSTHANEGFTGDYDLPNETAYAETCAAIGLVFWAHRMLQLDPDAEYADAMERALYNGVLSGISLDGTRFFYGNPLESRLKVGSLGEESYYRRSEWFGCACCPPNIARLLTSLGGYAYSQTRKEAWVHLYVNGRAELGLAGRKVVLEQKTEYPWKERVRIVVRPENPVTFTLALRIPRWCRGAKLTVNGRKLSIPKITRKGYAKIEREWKMGDKVELVLPMPIERVEANPKVREDAGRTALQRGPVVYCLESIDNPGSLSDITLPRGAKLQARFDKGCLEGVPVIAGKALRRDDQGWGQDLYRSAGTKRKPVTIKAIPYALWANREEGEMLVWIREG